MKRRGVIFLCVLMLAAGGWLYYQCAVNQSVNFLTPGPGAWVVYPTQPEAMPQKGITMTTVFRRVLIQPVKPFSATVTWRVFRTGLLFVNGISVAATESAHWKRATRTDVAPFLHQGANDIEVRANCDKGLPAMSLVLEMDGTRIESDGSWESSLAGAVWEPARPASEVAEPAFGHWLYGVENLRTSIRETWPLLAGFAIVSTLAVALWQRFGMRTDGGVASSPLLHPLTLVGFALIAAAWLLLFAHNIPLLPTASGFDANAHLGYMAYLQEHKTLPQADKGWEFFQAPLYYVLGAIALDLTRVQAMEPKAEQVLAGLNLLLAAAEMGMILASLRLLFPGRLLLQLAGLLLAAFLPAQIYIQHYPTNELMGAVTATGAIWLCLTILLRDNAGLTRYVWLGLMLGLAMLSKASGLVTVVAVFAALAVKAGGKTGLTHGSAEASPYQSYQISGRLGQIGMCAAVCVLVCGWHYWKLARQFGDPFIGGWDPALAPAWWQQPGYHTPSYYLTFGQSLVRPLFSGFHSFWDGLYSTWWGDGLIGGATRLYGRTPWNYNLMTLEYALALVPTGLVLTGLWRAVDEGLRERRIEWLFLAMVFVFYGLAIFSMSLKLPYYAHAKAFFGLSAILPYSFMGVLGLDSLVGRFQKSRMLLLSCLGCWLLTAYASFWIVPNTVPTRLSAAMGLFDRGGTAPAAAFAKVLELDPSNASALVALADIDQSQGQAERAVARLEAAASRTSNAMIDTELALDLGRVGRTQEGLEWARRACAISVEDASAPAALCSLALQAGHVEEAGSAGSLALRLAPQDWEIHYHVGLALMQLHRFEEAASHFRYAVDSSPNEAAAHYWLGTSLSNLPGKTIEAQKQVATALQLDPQNSQYKTTLDDMQRGLKPR